MSEVGEKRDGDEDDESSGDLAGHFVFWKYTIIRNYYKENGKRLNNIEFKKIMKRVLRKMKCTYG